MHPKKNDYVHRGDGERSRNKMRRLVLGIGSVCAVFAMLQLQQEEASATGLITPPSQSEADVLRQSLDSTMAELDITRSTLDRAERILDLSARFNVGAKLATTIHDVALAEGLGTSVV